MKGEILCIGTELLLGDIVNTNAQFLSRELASLGVNIYNQTVVGDNANRLMDALNIAFSRSNIVFTSGGLGPTKDDLTKETIAKFFDRKLVYDEIAYKNIERIMKRKNMEVSESNKKQAYIPEGAIPLYNDNGTAPGVIVSSDDKTIVMLPGPPKELIPMFKSKVVPYIKNKVRNVLVSKEIKIYGVGESLAADKICNLLGGDNPTVAPYAKEDGVLLRITASGKDEDHCRSLITPVEDEIKNIFKEHIYGEDDDTLEKVVVEKLIALKKTIATAESCTGGLVAATLVNYPGVSEVFMQGIVSYSNEAKMQRLGVKKETLDKFGAVSKEVAMEMAEGVAKTAGTNVGVSSTGIAGPGGGSEDKPVGLVYIGFYIDGDISYKELNLSGNRENIRHKAVLEILNELRLKLRKY